MAAIFELPPVGRATVELCCECSVTQLVYFPENISASLLAGAKQQPSVTVGVPATRRDSAGLGGNPFLPLAAFIIFSSFFKNSFLLENWSIFVFTCVFCIFGDLNEKNCSCLHGGGKKKEDFVWKFPLLFPMNNIISSRVDLPTALCLSLPFQFPFLISFLLQEVNNKKSTVCCQECDDPFWSNFFLSIKLLRLVMNQVTTNNNESSNQINSKSNCRCLTVIAVKCVAGWLPPLVTNQ